MKNYIELYKKHSKFMKGKSTKSVKAYKLDNLIVCFFIGDGGFFVMNDTDDLFESNTRGKLEDLVEMKIVRTVLDKLELESQLSLNSSKKSINKI